MERAEACASLANFRPTRREQATVVARLAADGLTILEITRAAGPHRQRVLALSMKYGIRIKSAGKGRAP
jgi:hypothetical protein